MMENIIRYKSNIIGSFIFQSWKIDISQTTVKFEIDNVAREVPLEDIVDVTIPSGIIWKKLTLHFKDSKYDFKGLSRGTAKNIKNLVYKIAGKTGTAQIAKPGGGYLKKYNASFAGYFPADNPMYSCVVLINNPNGSYYYATKVAAPVFKEVADKVYATRYDFRPENEKISDAQSLQAFK